MRYSGLLALGALIMCAISPRTASATAVKAFVTVRYCNVWDDPNSDNFTQPGHCYHSARFTAGVLMISRGGLQKAVRLNSRGEARTILSVGRYRVALAFAGCCAETVGCFGDGPSMIDRSVAVLGTRRGVARLIVRAYDRRPV